MHTSRAHPLWSCIALERIRIQRFLCITSFTVFGLQSSYNHWITVTYFLFILYFRNINVHDSPCQVPYSSQLMVSAADTWRYRRAKNWDEFMKLTTEKNILRTPEITQFEIARYHLKFPELALQMIWTQFTSALWADPRWQSRACIMANWHRRLLKKWPSEKKPKVTCASAQSSEAVIQIVKARRR